MKAEQLMISTVIKGKVITATAAQGGDGGLVTGVVGW